MHSSEFLTAWIRLAFTPQIGPRIFFKLLKRFKTPIAALENLTEIKQRYGLFLTPQSKTEVEDLITRTNNIGAEILLSIDDAYPRLLLEIDSYPPVLFARGNLELLCSPTIAIVGTRDSSLVGEKLTTQIASDLGKNGVVVVSGLAKGIDAAAHNGSLETGTVGVIAGGIDSVYPRENIKLYEALYEKGLVLTENQIGTSPLSKNFPRRNRIISGLSIGVLVVEAMQRSGTMITANYALEQGREVFAIPGSPMDPRSYGTNMLIKNGAVLVQTASDILNEIKTDEFKTRNDDLTGFFGEVDDDNDDDSEYNMKSLEERLLLKMSNVPISIDELLVNLKASASEFANLIVNLELSGKIIRKSDKISLI